MSFPSFVLLPQALLNSYSLFCVPLVHSITCLAYRRIGGFLLYKVSVLRDTDQAQQSWHSIQVFSVCTSRSYSSISNSNSSICAGNHRPDYVALTQRVDPTGRVTTYSKARERIKQTTLLMFARSSSPRCLCHRCYLLRVWVSKLCKPPVAMVVDRLLQPSNNHHR